MKKSQHLMIRRAVEIIALLLSGYIGDRFGQRILASCGGMVVGLVGMILIVALPFPHAGPHPKKFAPILLHCFPYLPRLFVGYNTGILQCGSPSCL